MAGINNTNGNKSSKVSLPAGHPFALRRDEERIVITPAPSWSSGCDQLRLLAPPVLRPQRPRRTRSLHPLCATASASSSLESISIPYICSETVQTDDEQDTSPVAFLGSVAVMKTRLRPRCQEQRDGDDDTLPSFLAALARSRTTSTTNQIHCRQRIRIEDFSRQLLKAQQQEQDCSATPATPPRQEESEHDMGGAKLPEARGTKNIHLDDHQHESDDVTTRFSSFVTLSSDVKCQQEDQVAGRGEDDDTIVVKRETDLMIQRCDRDLMIGRHHDDATTMTKKECQQHGVVDLNKKNTLVNDDTTNKELMVQCVLPLPQPKALEGGRVARPSTSSARSA